MREREKEEWGPKLLLKEPWFGPGSLQGSSLPCVLL